ncbi:MAG: LPS assembly protein LptD [Acidobacteriota bacterium]
MNTLRRFLAPALLTLFLPVAVSGQTSMRRPAPPKTKSRFSVELKPLKSGGTVAWTVGANGHQEIVKDEYALLEGEVKLTYQDVVISADKIRYIFKTQEAEAVGHVIIDQGPQRLSADRARYNLDSKTGTFYQAKASLEPSIYFTGAEIRKTGDDTYEMSDGVFTSCDIANPAWSFRIKSASIKLDDYAHLRDTSFRARSIPLFWTPYLLWPTKSDRSQGLLIPKPGYNSQFGAYLKNEYFLPVGTWADATVKADVFTNGLFGTGLETRYKPTQEINGTGHVYVVRDPGIDLPGETDRPQQWEWKYDFKHTQEGLPGGFRGVVDVKDFSDLEFFQRFERDFDLNTISNIYSSAYLTKNRPNYSLNLRTDRRKLFLGRVVNPDGSTSDSSRLFEQLPAIDFRTYPNRVGGTPLYFSLESSAGHLRTIDQGALRTPQVTADYFRADIHPTLTLQLKTPAWLSIKPQLSVRDTYYSSSLCDPLSDLNCSQSTGANQIIDRSLNRSYAQGEVEVVGPSLSKIYNFDFGGFTKFKHVIEPRVRYLYTTDVSDQSRVIRFDTIDSPALPLVQDSVEYSLTQRVIGKESGENASARDIMSLSVRQSASLSKPFSSSSFGATGANKFSPLTIAAHVNPYQRFTLDASASYGNVSRQLDQTSLSANLLGKKAYLNFTWFSTYENPATFARDSSQIRIGTGGPIWRDRWRGDAQINYDAGRSLFLEQRYLIAYAASCYDLALEYRDYLQFGGTVRKPARDYQFSVSLKNVGTFFDIRGSLGGL